MTIQNFVILFLFFITFLIAIESGAYLIFRYRTRLAFWCGLILLSLSLDLGGFLLQWISAPSVEVQFSFIIELLGFTLYCIFWLLFIYTFTRHPHWINRRNLIKIVTVPSIYLLIVLVRWLQGPVPIPSDAHLIGSLSYSPIMAGLPGFLFVGFGYGVSAFSTYLLIQYYRKSNAAIRRLIVPLFIGSIILVGGATLELAGINPLAPAPSHQIACTLICLLAFWVVLDLRVGSLLSQAREMVVDQMQDGVLIVDEEGAIIDLNPAAQTILQLDTKKGVRQEFARVLPEQAQRRPPYDSTIHTGERSSFQIQRFDHIYDVTLSDLSNLLYEPIGKMVVLRNVTSRELLEKTLQQRAMELQRANRMVIALSKVASLLSFSFSSDRALETLGEELMTTGLSCCVATFDRDVQSARIRYLSLAPNLIAAIERVVGFQLKNLPISRSAWPGDRILNANDPIWYRHPDKIFRKLFPAVPEPIAKKAIQLVGIQREDQFCLLPLIFNEQTIGVLAIWGSNLQPEDEPILNVFGSQVSSILSTLTNYEIETQRKEELTRSNGMIIALANVASKLGTKSELSEVFQTLGQELKKININCMVGTLDDEKQELKVEFLSINEEVMKWAYAFDTFWPKDLTIPRRLWPTDKAVSEKMPSWDIDPIGSASKMFPFVPRQIFLKAFEMADMDPEAPVCYLPMVVDEEVIGIMSVWGSNLNNNDLPGLSVFSNQVAIAIKDTRLLGQLQKELAERTQAEARAKEALSEREVLIKEVHHRVKNNLQVISSLLNLQAARISDQKAVDLLRVSQNRVRSMALIHEKLYQSSDLAHIDFGNYLTSLVNSLSQTYGTNPKTVEIRVECKNITLSIDTAIACGLIVNELVSNSLKYAFPTGQGGFIEVGFRSLSDHTFQLTVGDDGVGLPADFDIAHSPSLGLTLVNSLVQQIDGRLKYKNRKGAYFEIIFKEA